jgi:DNA repair exonuclease SbcCD nuclease subunit
MKILFSGDIHIRLGSKNVPVTWAKNRFQMFLEQFGEMQEQADLVVLGGDIFDRLPSVDEIELYFDLVVSLKKPTVIFDGNHEATKKSQTFLTFLKKSTSALNPLVRVVDDYEYLGDFDLDIIPYCRLKDFEKNHTNMDFKGRILCSHFRAEISPHVKPEIDLDLFNQWDVVLAGDLHSYENSQRNILYPGSPYTTSFHRSRVDTGAILLDASTLEHRWLKFNLPQLIKKTIVAGESAEPTSFDHTVYEVTGDMQELQTLEDSELVASKVIKRDSGDSALILTSDMTLTQEVRDYLTYILELPEPTIEKVLLELQNYLDKIN